MSFLLKGSAVQLVSFIKVRFGTSKVVPLLVASVVVAGSVHLSPTKVSAAPEPDCFAALGVVWDIDPSQADSFSETIEPDAVTLTFGKVFSEADNVAMFVVTFRPESSDCGSEDAADHVDAPAGLQFCWEWASGTFETTWMQVMDGVETNMPEPFISGEAEPVRLVRDSMTLTPGQMLNFFSTFDPAGGDPAQEVTLTVVFSSDGRCPGDEAPPGGATTGPWFDFSLDPYAERVAADGLPDTL